MYEVRKARDPQAIDPPPLDAHMNLKFFKQEQLKYVHYLAPGGDIRDDRATLKGCMDARLANRHRYGRDRLDVSGTFSMNPPEQTETGVGEECSSSRPRNPVICRKKRINTIPDNSKFLVE
jgi:hypothetical protein